MPCDVTYSSRGERFLRALLVVGLMLFGSSAFGNPEFTLVDIAGKKVQLADYRGKWVVINYWATWCPPCREEIPELVHFHEQHKDRDAVVLGVNMETVSQERLRQFVDENFMTYPVLTGSSDMQTVGPVPGLPTTYLVSPEGRLVARQVGAITAENIETFISKKP